MDHASRENIFDELNNFEKKKPADVPTILEEYLELIAKTGDILFSWAKLKPLFKHKLDKVIVKFNEDYPAKELPYSPNMEKFNYEEMHSKLLNAVEEFSGAPFTIQRLCELVVSPDKHYKRIDKFMRALEKDLLVVSTIEPLCKRQKLDCDNIPLMNGVTDGNNSHNGSAASPPRSGDVDVQSLDESSDAKPSEDGEPGEARCKQDEVTNGGEPSARLENGQGAAAVEQMEAAVTSSSSAVPETNGQSDHAEIKVNGEAVKETIKPSESAEPSTTRDSIINSAEDGDQEMTDVSGELPQPSNQSETTSAAVPLNTPETSSEAEQCVNSVSDAAAEVKESPAVVVTADATEKQSPSNDDAEVTSQSVSSEVGSLPNSSPTKPAAVTAVETETSVASSPIPIPTPTETSVASPSPVEQPQSSVSDELQSSTAKIDSPAAIPTKEATTTNGLGDHQAAPSSVLEDVSPMPTPEEQPEPTATETLPVAVVAAEESKEAVSAETVATTGSEEISPLSGDSADAIEVDTIKSDAEVTPSDEVKPSESVAELTAAEVKNDDPEEKPSEMEVEPSPTEVKQPSEVKAEPSLTEVKPSEIEAESSLTTQVKTSEIEAEASPIAEKPSQMEAETSEVEPEASKSKIEPSEAEVKLSEADAKSTEMEAESSEAEVKQVESAEKQPSEAEVVSAEAEVKPSEPEIKPSEAEVKPSEPEIKSSDAEVKSGETESLETEVKSSEVEVKRIDAEEKLSESDVKCSEKSEAEVKLSDEVVKKSSVAEVESSEAEVKQSEIQVPTPSQASTFTAVEAELEAKPSDAPVEKMESDEADVKESQVESSETVNETAPVVIAAENASVVTKPTEEQPATSISSTDDVVTPTSPDQPDSGTVTAAAAPVTETTPASPDQPDSGTVTAAAAAAPVTETTPASPDQPDSGASSVVAPTTPVTPPSSDVPDSQETSTEAVPAEKTVEPTVSSAAAAAVVQEEVEAMDSKDDEPDSTPVTTTTTPSSAVDEPEPMDQD